MQWKRIQSAMNVTVGIRPSQMALAFQVGLSPGLGKTLRNYTLTDTLLVSGSFVTLVTLCHSRCP